jgi:ParB family chromosome partitioning protein
MSKTKPGLGRGFDSLIPTHLVEEEFDPTNADDKRLSQTNELPITDVHPNPDQPRKTFSAESIAELAESIKQHGVLQPLIVSKDKDGYRLVAGERRYRASKKAGLKKVPVIIRSMDEQAELEVALIENLQREDLNPLEVATALLKLSEQFNMDRAEIGKHVGRSASAVSNTIRLLGLSQFAKQALAKGDISEGHARAILATPAEKQDELLENIVKNGWSVRRAEQFATAAKKGGDEDAKKASGGAEHQNSETKKAAKKLGTEVRERPMAKGAGRIVIDYKDDGERARIYELLT